MSARQAAATVLDQVIRHGRSMSDVLPPAAAGVPEGERALLQELVYGTLRWYPRLDALLGLLLQRPLRRRDGPLRALLLCGLYQCLETRVPAHAAVSETVDAARRLGQSWAPGLVNAVLRRLLRERDALEAALDDEVARYAHPAWLLHRLQADWPDHWQAIVEAGNQRPPMTLRVNRRRLARDAYRTRLLEAGIASEPHPYASDALVLESPMAVERLPGFADGLVSVQDAAGQLAPDLLAPEPGDRILDVCAAPGSKTCHLLERQPALDHLTALDVDGRRLERLTENLARLGLSAERRVADATEPDSWWDGQPYQRILLDAPCSATGVIRRHPDIKLLRRDADIAALQGLQERLLAAVWSVLAPGGMLVYATCSMLRAENEVVIERFVQAQADARHLALDVPWGVARPYGRHILVGEAGMDGFFYACLRKERHQ